MSDNNEIELDANVFVTVLQNRLTNLTVQNAQYEAYILQLKAQLEAPKES